MSKEQVLDLVGTVIPENLAVERDAIHVAVLPVRGTTAIKRGMWLSFAYEGDIEMVMPANTWALAVGVADPFLSTNTVAADERFLMFMKPNTITGLRHHWDHPALDAAMGVRMKNELLGNPSSRSFMETLAADCHMSFDALMNALTEVATGAEEYISLGIDTPDTAYDSTMWDHYERLTGKIVPYSIKRAGAPFSCAC